MVAKVRLTPAQREHLERTVEAVKAADELKKKRFIDFFVPYPKQQEFFDAGSRYPERVLQAGNQFGKSIAGSFEAACHATGNYPEDWLGYKFDRPVVIWACGESSTAVRNVSQRKLCGIPGIAAEDRGIDTSYPMIPAEDIHGKPLLSHGVTGAYDMIFVRHKTRGQYDGVSTIHFKSYEQGRDKFQGESVDVVWLDEEPPADIYTECLARTAATGGIVFITFTPLSGFTDVVKMYREDTTGTRAIIKLDAVDVPHMTPEKVARLMAQYPEHEWDARIHGEAYLGSGAVFRSQKESIREAASSIPPHWCLLWGIDLGVTHPFAAVLVAWDRDTDVVHVVHEIRMKNALTVQHAEAMKAAFGGKGGEIPVAWPHDANAKKEFDGDLKPVFTVYKKHGLAMLPKHATFPDGSISTEAGILAMDERMRTNRLKVFDTCAMWFEEYGRYHRKDGLLVKIDDDLMSATRQAVMQLRSAKPGISMAYRGQAVSQTGTPIAKDADIDPFGDYV